MTFSVLWASLQKALFSFRCVRVKSDTALCTISISQVSVAGKCMMIILCIFAPIRLCDGGTPPKNHNLRSVPPQIIDFLSEGPELYGLMFSW